METVVHLYLWGDILNGFIPVIIQGKCEGSFNGFEAFVFVVEITRNFSDETIDHNPVSITRWGWELVDVGISRCGKKLIFQGKNVLYI